MNATQARKTAEENAPALFERTVQEYQEIIKNHVNRGHYETHSLGDEIPPHILGKLKNQLEEDGYKVSVDWSRNKIQRISW